MSDGDRSQQVTKDAVKPRLSQTEIRGLWRKAILETLLLIRMERENKNLQGKAYYLHRLFA